MKKLFLFLAMTALLLCTACGASDKNLEGVYSPDPISYGYRFTSDGIVQYYETQWEKQPLKEGGCDPVFWYGTYTLEDKALTIKISGADHEISGVIMSEGQVIINGESCEKLPAGYYTDFSDNHPSWADLDKELGLS